MNPTCYPALEMLPSWEFVPQGPGTCMITPGSPTVPMKVLYHPAAVNPWPQAYVLHRNAFSAATEWSYPITFTFPTQQDINNCEAPEIDRQDNPGTTMFNWGWQLRQGTGLFVWNRAAHEHDHSGGWEGPVLPASAAAFTPGVPKQVVVLHARDATHLTYLGVSIDGLWTPLNITYPAVPKVQTPYTNNAWQLDSKGQGAPITCYVRCNLEGF